MKIFPLSIAGKIVLVIIAIIIGIIYWKMKRAVDAGQKKSTLAPSPAPSPVQSPAKKKR
jgi:hypothetical protein